MSPGAISPERQAGTQPLIDGDFLAADGEAPCEASLELHPVKRMAAASMALAATLCELNRRSGIGEVMLHAFYYPSSLLCGPVRNRASDLGKPYQH